MCGLAGLILGPRARMAPLAGKFKIALAASEARGSDASGVAVVRLDGASIFKRPAPASLLTGLKGFDKAVSRLDGSAVSLLGHARWATVGDPKNNANNHPIQAGSIIGTHNGTITNADRLFMAWGLPRTAEVDSEVFLGRRKMP